MARSGKENAVSDYEAQRLEKIAKNKALFQELQLNAASAGIALSSNNKRSRPSDGAKKAKPVKRVKVEDEGPRRTSSRIRGIVADSEVAERKAEEERVAWQEAERAKRQRNAADIVLSDAVVAGQSWDQSGNWLRNVRAAQPYERTFTEDDVKQPSSKEIKELREKLSSLELWGDVEPSRIKITPERIYSMVLHPTEEKALVFAGDKMGNLGLFDGSQRVVKYEGDDDELGDDMFPAISTFKMHTRTISAMHCTPSQPNSLFTASYDSSIRRLDLEKSVATEVYAPASLDTDDPLSGISIPIDAPHMLYFTTLNGQLGMHDSRTQSSTVTQFYQLSEKKIGGFSVHPQQPHLLATASLDRTLKLWDLRNLSGKRAARLPTLVAEHESKLSVSHAAFNGAGQIATSSYDDTIKLHSLNGIAGMDGCGSWTSGTTLTDDQFKPSAIIPHNNQTGRWVTILRPHWQQHPSTLGGGAQRFVIGNMNRFVDVYAGSGEQLAQLGGEGITAVPAVAVYHPSKDWIAAGTASGKLCLWL